MREKAGGDNIEADMDHDKAFSFFNKLGGDENFEGCEAYKQLWKIDLKGIGISLIDHNPKEICYISIYRP